MSEPERLRVGTRASALARAQTSLVTATLKASGWQVDEVLVRTRGDVDRSTPASQLDRGAFVAALERALIEGRVDIAVHSAKDVPTDELEGTTIVAFPSRGDPRDALVTRHGHGLDDLPPSARVGTGSPRRRAFLLRERPDLEVVPMRGNIDTRLARVDRREIDAVVLAAAGLDRLGLAKGAQRLDPSRMLPAVGQGALAVQVRADAVHADAVRTLDDPPTRAAVLSERAFLRSMGGGCQTPLAAMAQVDGGEIHLAAAALNVSGSEAVAGERTGRVENAERVGCELADELLSAGASALLTG